MDQPGDTDDIQRRKGKLRATQEDPSETTPLLGASSSDQLIRDDTPSIHRRHRQRLFVLLSTVFLSTLFICLLVILVISILAYSYRSKVSEAVRDGMLFNRALVVRGPDRIDVLNATEGTVWILIDGRIGIDAGAAIDTVLEADSDRRVGSGLNAVRRAMGRWFVRRLGSITVSVDEVTLSSKESFLANVSTPTISLPLTLDPPDDLTWLTPLSIPIQATVTDNATDLEAFAQESWRNGVLSLRASASLVTVHGGSKDETNWRRRLQLKQDRIVVPIRCKIPDLPGLPTPGRDTPFPEFSDLVTLKSFNITSHNHTVRIQAAASLIDPLPLSLNMRVPSLPFVVSLPNTNLSISSSLPHTVPVATGHTLPFSLTHPNISLSLIGTVPPIPRNASPILSSFLSAYLSGHDAPIVIGSPLLPALALPAAFPAPHPKPQILRDVQIKDMRILPSGDKVLASGTVFARVVLPAGIRLTLDAERIWPDVLVFDGEVPSDPGEDDLRASPTDLWGLPTRTKSPKGRVDIPKEPLPSPLPARAFARIRPDDWLPSISVPIVESDPDPDSGGGASEYEVSAKVENVPLEVLPGRDRLLRSFVAKVIFGTDGALAGVQGTAAVAVAVDGLPVEGEPADGGLHVMELTGLPFTGSFRVGKKFHRGGAFRDE